MRMRIVALTFGLGIAACGGTESRPVQDPSTTSATTPAGNAAPVTTTYDTTLPASPRAPVATTDSTTTGTSSMGTSSTGTPASSSSRTTPASDAFTTPAPAPNAAAVVNNPGVADQTKNADNTKINDRDRHGALTPMDQGNSKPEIAITAAIRKSVLADKTLSFTAKNVKIITVGSKVTLRGPVGSEQERAAIEARARQTAGVTEVDNQIEIKK